VRTNRFFVDRRAQWSGGGSGLIVGVATEVGIEPTVRHGADKGLIPIVVTDACGAGNPATAMKRRTSRSSTSPTAA
jgi:nicotinamidase-related amidase